MFRRDSFWALRYRRGLQRWRKFLTCPPGASPLSLSEHAMEKLHRLQSKVSSWYLVVSIPRWSRADCLTYTILKSLVAWVNSQEKCVASGL